MDRTEEQKRERRKRCENVKKNNMTKGLEKRREKREEK